MKEGRELILVVACCSEGQVWGKGRLRREGDIEREKGREVIEETDALEEGRRLSSMRVNSSSDNKEPPL